MKIIAISDTHTQHDKIIIPDGDIIIHSGDATYRGSIQEITNFVNWYAKQPFKYRIFISGNHDKCFQNNNRDYAINLLKQNNIIYLEDSSIEIDGIYFYGSPWQPQFGYGWAFNLPRGKPLAEKWSQIPENTNVLITHGPAYGKLDRVENFYSHDNVGCKDLWNRIKNLKNLKASIAGHLHLQGGNMIEVNGVKYINAACCDEAYNPIQLPVVFEI